MAAGAVPATGAPRATAVLVGVLFIVATGAFVAGQGVYGGILDSADYLSLAHPGRVRVLSGIVLQVVGVLAIPLIGLTVYPVLRLHSDLLALAYIGTRTLEGVALLVADFNSWALVSVSEGYLDAGPADQKTWEVAGAALQSVSEASFLISVVVLFPIGVLLLNSVLWSSRLVPRFISGWGFAAGLLLFLVAVPGILELVPAVPELILTGPIAIQEMALAVWLIAKGFSVGTNSTSKSSVRTGPG